MLIKLFKYEFKATARLFWPMYAAVLIFTVINRLLYSGSISKAAGFTDLKSALSVISTIIYIILIVGMMVMTLIVMIQRFYKNLLGDEGYLMLTLPVRTWEHIASKLAAAMLWTVLSGLIAACSIIIIANISAPLPKLSEVFVYLEQYIGYIGIFEIFLLLLLGTAGNILLIYSAIALGQLFNKHRLLASFGMFIAVSTVIQIISSIFMYIFESNGSVHILSTLGMVQIQLYLFYVIIYTIIPAAGCFAMTDLVLRYKLNLE